MQKIKKLVREIATYFHDKKRRAAFIIRDFRGKIINFIKYVANVPFLFYSWTRYRYVYSMAFLERNRHFVILGHHVFVILLLLSYFLIARYYYFDIYDFIEILSLCIIFSIILGILNKVVTRENWIYFQAENEFKRLRQDFAARPFDRFRNYDWSTYGKLIIWPLSFLFLSFWYVFLFSNEPLPQSFFIHVNFFAENIKGITSIFASMFAIVITLIIFGARKSEGKSDNFANIFFDKSKLEPIVIFGLLFITASIASFVYIDEHQKGLFIILFILLIVNLSWMAYLVRELIFASGPPKFLSIIEELLKRYIGSGIKKELVERVATSLFFKRLGKWNHFTDEYEDDHHYILSNKQGYIMDINVKLIEKIEEAMLRKGEKRKFLGYVVSLGRYVRKGDVIFGVPKIHKKLINGIRSNNLVRVEDSDGPKAVSPISDLRKLTIDSIKLDDEEKLKLYLNIYDRIIEFYIKKLNDYGFVLDKKQSRGGDFRISIIELLTRDFEDILLASLKSQNRKLYDKILYYYKFFLISSFENNSFVIFRKFNLFPSYLYYVLNDKRLENYVDDDLKDDLMKNATRLLQEVADHHIERSVKRANTIKSVEYSGSFLELIVESFSGVLYRYVMTNNNDGVGNVMGKVNRIFKHFDTNRVYRHLTVESVEQLKKSVSDTEYKKLKLKAEINDKIHELVDDYRFYRDAMLYGIGAWAVEMVEHNKIDINSGRAIVLSILNNFPGDGNRINKVFEKVVNDRWSESRFDFGWDFWDPRKHETGVMYDSWISSEEWLLKLFVIWGVKNPDKKIEPNITLKNSIDGVVAYAESLRSHDKFDGVIAAANKGTGIDAFIASCNEAVEKYKEIEIDELIAKDLDRSKKETYADNLRIRHNKAAFSKQIFKKFGKYIDNTSQSVSGEDIIRRRVLDSKGIFVENHPIGYVDPEVNQALFLAGAENRLSIIPMLNNSKKMEYKSENVIDKIDKLIEHLRDSGYNSQVIFLPYDFKIENELEGNSSFTKKASIIEGDSFHSFVSFDEFLGLYKNVPVFLLEEYILKDKILVADINKGVKWTQLQVDNTVGIEVRVKIEKITEELAKGIINEDPDKWLSDKQTGEKKSRNEVIRYLQQRALIKYGTNFKVDIIDKKAIISCAI